MFSLASHFPSLSPAQVCWVEVEFSSKLLKKNNQPKVYRIPAHTWMNFVLCFLLHTLTSRWKASEIPGFVLLAVGRWQWHWAVHPLQVPQTCIFHCSHLRGEHNRLWGHGGISLVPWAAPAGAGAAGACPNQGGKSPSSAGPGRDPRLVQEGLCRHVHLCPDLLLSRGNLSSHVSVYSVVRWMA